MFSLSPFPHFARFKVTTVGFWDIVNLRLVSQVHLLCLIANGMFRGRLCSEPDLLAITLSLLPAHFSMVAEERIDQNYLSGLLKWCVACAVEPEIGVNVTMSVAVTSVSLILFSSLSLLPFRFTSTFTLNASLSCEESLNPRALLERRLASLSARNHQEMTHVGVLRQD